MIAIFKKELRDHLRDRGAVVMVLVFVMLAPFLLGGLFTMLAGREDALAAPPPVAAQNLDAAGDLARHLVTRGYDLESSDDAEAAVRNRAAALGLRIPTGYGTDFAAGRRATVEVLVDDSRHRREADRLVAVLSAYGGEVASLRLIARGVAPQLVHTLDIQRRDFSTPANRAAELLGTLVIFLLVMPFVASMGIATDTLAGERERRSLDLLLAQPLGTRDVIAGKWLATVVFAIVGFGLMLIISGLTLPRFDLSSIGMQVALPCATLAGIFVVMTPLALLAASAQLALSQTAKNFKEAQFYMSMLMFVPMGAGFVLGFRDADLPGWAGVLPLVAQHTQVSVLVRGDGLALGSTISGAVVTLVAAYVLMRATAARLARHAD